MAFWRVEGALNPEQQQSGFVLDHARSSRNLLISTVDMSAQAANPLVADAETARAESEK